MKCSKCGKEMSFENTTGRGFDIGLCESCEWDKGPADLPEAGASAQRICSVVRSLPSQEEINNAIDSYGFQVPYNGTNEFYDKERMKHFKAGIDFVLNHVKGQ